MKSHIAAAALAAALAASCAAQAHEAFFARTGEGTSDRTFVLGDAGPARVVYVHAGCPAGLFRARIDAAPRDTVYIALGVPALPELRRFRPTVHLVGPDLPVPEVRPPFEIPRGAGMITLVAEPEPPVVPDPVTGASSWRLFEHRLPVSRRAAYEVVVDLPDQTGRFWLESGRGDGPDNRAAIPAIRRFFDPQSASGLGRSCSEEERISAEGSGFVCGVERAGHPRGAVAGALLLGFAAVFGARRRRGGARRGGA